jgi:hypothetical protein
MRGNLLGYVVYFGQVETNLEWTSFLKIQKTIHPTTFPELFFSLLIALFDESRRKSHILSSCVLRLVYC